MSGSLSHRMTGHRVRFCTGILTGARYITSREDMSLFPRRWNISDSMTPGSAKKGAAGKSGLQKKHRPVKFVSIRYEERRGLKACTVLLSRPVRGEWIEIMPILCAQKYANGLAPYGASGLKSQMLAKWSLVKKVSPRMGRVD